jgi:hypothetical protein
MAWYLNTALTEWRNDVNPKYPKRSKTSDGTIGDRAHAASVSEHNPDFDGSVDAWDMDVNLFGSSVPTGTLAERAEIESLIRIFQADPRSELWIWDGYIASRSDGWRRRRYYGANAHDHHVHWQSRFIYEKRAGDWITEDGDRVTPAQPVASIKPVRDAINRDEVVKLITKLPGLSIGTRHPTVKRIQVVGNLFVPQDTKVDGVFGADTARVVKAMQVKAGIRDTGVVDVATWNVAICASATAKRLPQLGPGVTGEAAAVRRAQVILTGVYGKQLTADGVYGPATQNAVRAVQQLAKLTRAQDGRVELAEWLTLWTGSPDRRQIT